MRSVSPLSITLVLSAIAAAAGFEIARRFAASGREIAALRSSVSHLSGRVVEQTETVRDLRSDLSHEIRRMERSVMEALRKQVSSRSAPASPVSSTEKTEAA